MLVDRQWSTVHGQVPGEEYDNDEGEDMDDKVADDNDQDDKGIDGDAANDEDDNGNL